MNNVSLPLSIWTHPVCADYRRGWRLARLVNLFRIFQLAGEPRTLRMRFSNWRANLDYPLRNVVAFMERLQTDGLATWTVENADAGDDAFGTLVWADFLTSETSAPEPETTRQPRPVYPSDRCRKEQRREGKNGSHSTPQTTPQTLRTDSANSSAATPQANSAESRTRTHGERDSLREREISPLGGNLSLSTEEGSGEKGGANADSANTPPDESAWSELSALYDPASVKRVRQFIAAKKRAGEKFGSEISYARQILENDLKAQGNGRGSPPSSGGPSMADIEQEIGAELEALNIYDRFPGIEREGAEP